MKNGNILGKPNIPTKTLVNGIWDLSQQYSARRSDIWPMNALPILTNLLTWHDAFDATTVTLSGSSVTQWIDKSGNNQTLIPRSGTNPGYISGDSLTFNGTQYLYRDLGYNVSSARTLYLVCTLYQLDPPATSTGAGALGFENNTTDSFDTIGYNENSPRKWQTESSGGAHNIIGSTSETRVNQKILVSASYNTNFIRLYRMGTLEAASNTLSPFTNQNRLIVGVRHNSFATPPGNGYWYGTISECITYSVVHSDVDRGSIETYLKTKWGIP